MVAPSASSPGGCPQAASPFDTAFVWNQAWRCADPSASLRLQLLPLERLTFMILLVSHAPPPPPHRLPLPSTWPANQLLELPALFHCGAVANLERSACSHVLLYQKGGCLPEALPWPPLTPNGGSRCFVVAESKAGEGASVLQSWNRGGLCWRVGWVGVVTSGLCHRRFSVHRHLILSAIR